VRNYWIGLRRGQADIPFTDDVRLSEITDAAEVILLDVFQSPARFRIAVVTRGLIARYGQSAEGLFADEMDPKTPLDYLQSQCSATVEGRAPTYYRSETAPAYARLMLPLWGDGHINALLCAIA
jgi:hypothetical protein